jgi:fumarylacetoacetate (FAA) hydrolase
MAMKLATLKSGKPDGELVVVSRDLTRMARVPEIAPHLQAAIDDWARARPKLEERSRRLNDGSDNGAEPFDAKRCHSPLPRAYQWLDGSVYAGHNERMSAWRKRELDPRWYKEPWMYQGCSDGFLAPTEDIPGVDEAWGIDYEGEIAVVTDAVPYGCTTEEAGKHIVLVMLANDVSLRELMVAELSKGFGFVQTKPASAFSPVAATLDELGGAWRDDRLHLPLHSWINGKKMGDPDAGEMAHSFARLISHGARTRSLAAGTIVGSGTVASKDAGRGVSCLAEQRVNDDMAGKPQTPYLRFGDKVKIEMYDAAGKSVFGAIEQTVRKVG